MDGAMSRLVPPYESAYGYPRCRDTAGGVHNVDERHPGGGTTDGRLSANVRRSRFLLAFIT